MSLQVPDSRSRGRSSSRSRSKSRDHSHSRPRSQSRSRSKSKSRSKSRDPSVSRRISYRDSDAAVDRLRARSRSRSRSRDPRRSSGRLSSGSVALGSAALGLGAGGLTGSTVSSGSGGSGHGHRRSKSGYEGDRDRDRDGLEVDQDGQRRRRRRRHSYLTDEDRYAHSDTGSRRNGYDKYGYRAGGTRTRDSTSASGSESDEVDDRLAYGDLPGSRKSNRKSPLSATATSTFQSLWSALPRGSDSMLPSSTKREDPSSGVASRQPSSPGVHPSYAHPEPFRYANPMQYLQSKPQSKPQSQGYSAYNPSPSATSAPPLQVPPDWAPIPDCEQPGFVPPSSQAEDHGVPGAFPSGGTTSTASPGGYPAPQYGGRGGGSYSPAGGLPMYANPPAFQYAQIDPNIRYSSKNPSRPLSYPNAPQYANVGPGSGSGSGRDSAPAIPPPVPAAPPPPASKHRPHASTSAISQSSADPQYVEISPGGRKDSGSGRHRRHHSQSVSSVNSNNLSVALPDPTLRPSSPLQEPYQGTYQSISPMPSPIVLPSKGDDDDISDTEMLGRSSHRRKKTRDDREHKDGGSSSKRDSSRVRHGSGSGSGSGNNQVILIEPGVSQQRHVSFYNPTADAIAMQEALSHVRHIDHKTLIRILPRLSNEDMLDLRKEYKRHVKIHGKGINIAKHINLKLGSNTAFGKACYATALGRWESEAYWANCYYQSGSSRRELLIESLMGRSNSEIHAIKECFRDPRYMDSLDRCMRAELKADKFRMAVLMALEEGRQSEREPLDDKLIDRDMYELHRSLVSRDGGESAMISIIVRRSDAHLREVLQEYERTYRHNFARAMIAKSPNLVVCPRPLFPPNVHNVPA